MSDQQDRLAALLDDRTFHDAWVARGFVCSGTHAVGEGLCQNITAFITSELAAGVTVPPAEPAQERYMNFNGAMVPDSNGQWIEYAPPAEPRAEHHHQSFAARDACEECTSAIRAARAEPRAEGLHPLVPSCCEGLAEAEIVTNHPGLASQPTPDPLRELVRRIADEAAVDGSIAAWPDTDQRSFALGVGIGIGEMRDRLVAALDATSQPTPAPLDVEEQG